MIDHHPRRFPSFDQQTLVKIGAAVVVGLVFGVLVVAPPYLPVPANFQKLVWVIPFIFLLVVLFKNLERLILFAIAISVPLNLDFSVIISPFARNAVNIAHGNRTLVALTELRVSLLLLVVLAGYVLWMVERQGPNRQRVRFFAATSIPALGLIFLSITSLFQAEDTQLSLFKIANLVELFFVYFYLVNHLRTKRDLYFFLVVLMGGMLAQSILMVVQWRTGWGFSIPGVFGYSLGNRAAGLLRYTNVAGGIIAAQLIINGAMVILFPKLSQKIFAGICLLVGCIALISTAGRAAWGSFIAAILCFMLFGWRRGLIKRSSLVWLTLIVLIIGATFYPTISNRLTADDRGSAGSRPMMFRLAWNVIQASPSHLFFGVGANNYALIAFGYNTADVGNLGYVIDSSVHNAYLLTWAEIGLFGFLSMLSFLAVPLVNAWKHIKSDNRFCSLVALGLGCSLLAMYIQMLVEPFIVRPINNYLWILIAVLTSLTAIKTEQVASYVSLRA